MKIFIDSDVLLDFFLNREPFAEQSGQLLRLCERCAVNAVSVDRTVHCIVTRNVKDYRKSLLPVQIPSDFQAYAQQHLTLL